MLQSRQEHGQHDQKGTSPQEDDRKLDQDRVQVNASHCLEESMALRGDDPVSELYIWGNDYYGQLGVGSEKVIHNLPKVCSFNIVVTDVSCGEEHTVFVQGDGGYVYAMGSNSEGRLGTGNAEIRSCNVPTLVDGLYNIKKVSCGSAHSLALSDDGKAYAWGQAFYGALGIAPNERGALENAHTPQLLPAEAFGNEAVKDLQAGGRHTIFVTARNKVFGCGDANQGQLGLGDANRDRVLEPTQIKDSLQGMDVMQVACGKYHTLVLVENPREGSRRELWAFGANNFGQIGNNSNQNMFSPVRIDPRQPDEKHSSQSQRSHKFSQISAWHASAAVTDEGVMYVWGSGIFGEFKRPRKVKLQNNIKVNKVIVGGSFVVIVDQDNRVVVWGSNQNGEIGVGDSKIRSHPTRLETIEEKIVSHVSVGGSFAFAIGKTTTRMDNSIFDEGNRSQLSGIQKNGNSHLVDGFKDVDRNNRSINSLEEQLQQIALHSASKKRQDSDQKQRPAQDRSFGSHSATNTAAAATRFDQAAARLHIGQHQSSGSAKIMSDDRGKAADDHVEYLKKIIEEKERKINDLTEMGQKKHEDYQEKLGKFKQMQDQELSMTNKLRDENKRLRQENESLKDEIEGLQRDARAEQRRRDESSYAPASQADAYTPKAEARNDNSSQYIPLGHDSSANRAIQQPISTLQSVPTSSNPPNQATASYVPSTYQGAHNSLQSAEQLSQTSKEYSHNAQMGASTHYKYEPALRPGGEKPQKISANQGDRYSPAPKQPRTAIEEMNDRAPSINDERFQSTYLRVSEHQHTLDRRQQPEDQLRAEPTDQRSRDFDTLSAPGSAYQAGRSSHGPLESRKMDPGYGKVENLYKQRFSDAYPGHIQLTSKHERISVDVEQMDRSRQNSSGKKEFQRAFTAENPGAGGFMRQSMLQRNLGSNGSQDSSIAAHARRTSLHEEEQRSTHELTSSYARRDTGENTSQTRLGAPSASHSGLYPSRERMNTGRVENLRSMGSELMRPSSRDGPANGPVVLHHKLESDSQQQQQQQNIARNSSTGYYQPQSKYTARTGEYRRTEEEERQSFKQLSQIRDDSSTQQMTNTGLPDPTDIQNRLKQANRYSQQLERSPDKVRSVTPNAGSSSNMQDPLHSRVSYKPSNYDHLLSQQADHKDSRSGYGYSPAVQQQRNQDSGRKMKTDFASDQISTSKDQSHLLQHSRPDSASRREPLYQTQNSNTLVSLNYENMAPGNEGFSNMYSRNQPSQGRAENEFKGSPGKPPRQDQARTSTEYASYSTKFQYSASMGGNKIDANPAESKPPTYKPLDYQSRYSHDPGHRFSSDAGLEDVTKASADGSDNAAATQSKYGRLSIDNVMAGADFPSTSGNQSQTPSYSNARLSAGADNGAENGGHQQSSSFGYGLNTYQQKHQNEDASQQKRSDPSGDLLPNSYSTFGGHQTMNFSQKPRSPFTMQHLNDQMPSNADSYNRIESGYQTKVSDQASSYPQNMGATSFTPQGSGRRGASLTENRSSSNGAGGGGEHIRAKLARYKKEREDFEMIRQQFRKKNSELSTSAANVSTSQNPAGGNQGVSENTPVNRSMSGSNHQYAGLASVDYNASAAAKGSNIFAVEHSGGSQVKAFTASGHMTSGSPAFGLPEQSQSREH